MQKDNSIYKIKELLRLNPFLSGIQSKLKKESDRISVANKLRELAGMHPDRYRIEYKNIFGSSDLVLFEKKPRILFGYFWEEVISTSKLVARDSFPKEFS